ncbi:hypothetical protein BYT27DRAFT_7171817 [Phlegmacium glaucopus]|nr:hypothetical protein BYT27DRAFT_7171817 [Phlegmacium glaucopus]
MPQVSRKDPPSQRVQDKESKRARGALSCAECRRLKLKCDKTVPCSSCKRRGCSAICPNGSLITGQGTRFVLADTEKLHQKIAKMSDRIRLLEDALAILQSTVSGPGGEPHPLLHRDLLAIKSSIELHSATQGAPGEDGIDAEEGEGDEEQYIDAFGTLAIHDDGAATFYGRSAGSESLLIGEAAASPSTSSYSYSDLQSNPSQSQIYYSQEHSNLAHTQQHHRFYSSSDVSLPSSITSLAASFPLVPSLPAPESPTSTSLTHFKAQPITLRTLTTYYLPTYTEALRLIQIYLEQAPWFFGAVTRRQIEEEMLPLWYEEAAALASSPPLQQQAPSGPGTQTQTVNTPPSNISSPSTSSILSGKTQSQHSQPRTGNSHDLALLFVLFCFGALTDTNLPSPPDNIPAERFYQLTKVSLNLDPQASADSKSSRNGIFERPPSVATVQALSLMAIYEGICSGENSIESTWALMGLACKLAQSVGLHRDCARWKLTPGEVQKRRALFWELFITDCWQSLATGRLSTFSLPFVDCELPFDPDQTMADDGTIQPSFPYWKARFGAECVSAVVQSTLTSRAPKYSIILELDRKVRDMDLPLYAQGQPPQGKGLAETMSHFMPLNYRELTLLYIHRCFFAHAISSNPSDPIKSQYAPSFLAGYRSACTIVASVKHQFTLFPAQIARFWVLWTHAFSASVMLASVATHSSRSRVAPAALLELKNACDMFEDASAYGGRAIKFLPIMRRLQIKAQQAYRDANSGLPPKIPNDIFKPSNPEEETKDELSIFSGKTHTLTAKSTSTSTAAAAAGGSVGAGSTSSKSYSSSSNSPQMVLTDNPSFAGVHSSLVSELNMFDGVIKSQIENAFKAGGEVFGGGPMVVDEGTRGQGSSSSGVRHEQPTQMHTARLHHHQQSQQQQYQQQQQQQQQAMHQPDYQRQHFDGQETEQLKWEREEAANREMERQERERQELARQQQLHQQRRVQRQQAHEQEIQRQQHELLRQQQMQDQHRQQLEIQQRQLPQQKQQQQQAVPQYRQQRDSYDYDDQQHQSQMLAEPDHGMVVSSTSSSHVSSRHSAVTALPPMQRHVSQSQSQPNIHQAYQQHQQHHYQPTHHSDAAGLPPPSHAPLPPGQHISQRVQPHTRHSVVVQQPQQQHSMYAVPQKYSQYPTPDLTSGTSSVNYATPSTPAYVPPTPISATSSSSSYVTYWPAASDSFAMPDQQPTSSAPGPGSRSGAGSGGSAYDNTSSDLSPHMQQIHERQHHHQHYTPEGALRGIAADDHSLQETWQSYMSKVGSPRQFFDD